MSTPQAATYNWGSILKTGLLGSPTLQIGPGGGRGRPNTASIMGIKSSNVGFPLSVDGHPPT